MYEKNQIQKTWHTDMLKIALLYPNQYSSMAGLTIQTLYNLWNTRADTLCERFFLPSPEFKDLMPTHVHVKQKLSQIYKAPAEKQPPLRSLENQMPLAAFDIIAISFSYEMDYPHILWILKNAKIPSSAQARHPRNLNEEIFQWNPQDEEFRQALANEQKPYPLIIAGGPTIRSNPLPLMKYIDAFFIGEIEPVNDQFLEAWFSAYNNEELLTQSQISDNFLKNLSKTPGFWVPFEQPLKTSLKISRIVAKDMDKIPHPIHQIISFYPKTEDTRMPFHNAFFIEINRGCPHMCRFCMTGSQLKPFRNRSLAKLKEIIKEGLDSHEIERIILIGSSVSDHPQFQQLCEFLTSQRLSFSIPSVRIDRLTPKMIELIGKSGMKTITIAPETGTDRLRIILGKKITNNEIISHCEEIWKGGIRKLKLYFLYGLPYEKYADLDAIANLLKKIIKIGFKTSNLNISMNPFIPKPHTPFETILGFYQDFSLSELNARRNYISDLLQKQFNIQLEGISTQEAFLQALLAIGDPQFSSLIENLEHHQGKIRKSYKEILDPNSSLHLIMKNYLSILDRQKFGNHPWNFLDLHYPLQILEKERDMAEKQGNSE